MNTNNFLLAKKYAIAFLNVNKSNISINSILKVDELTEFLKCHKQDLFYIQLFDKKSTYFKQAFYNLLQEFEIDKRFESIINVLIESDRLLLIVELLESISGEYKKQEKISSFIIESAHELTKEELEKFVHFLETKTNTKVYYKAKINPKLIAGIKTYSNDYGWDYSVLKKLKNLDSYIWK